MLRVAATAVAVLLWCGQARADGTGVLVLGEPTLQQPVRAMVLGWLKEHGHTIIPSAFDSDAQSTFANCFVIEDLGCARGVFEQRSHGDSLVYARIELQPGKRGRHVVLTGYWFVKERDAVADKRACTSCDDKALTVAIGSMMEALAKGSGLDKGRVKLLSKPAGLVVMLDDIKIGVTPIEKDLGAGPHTIKLVKDGKVAALKNITVTAGGEADYTLTPESHEPVKVVEKVEVVKEVTVVHEPSRALPMVLLIGGLGAAVTGGVMLYYGGKSGPNEPFTYTTATRNGEIFGAAGGAALVLGAILWFTAKPTETTGPTAALASGGATIGWAGSF